LSIILIVHWSIGCYYFLIDVMMAYITRQFSIQPLWIPHKGVKSVWNLMGGGWGVAQVYTWYSYDAVGHDSCEFYSWSY